MYDDYSWMAAFGDPLFERHRAAARLWGSLALLLSSLPALPFNYSRTAHVLMVATHTRTRAHGANPGDG